MNNIKYYNDSLAYDFEMFDEKPAKVSKNADNILTMPTGGKVSSQKRRAAARTISPSLTVVMLAIFVLAGLCGNIALRLRINEVNSKISSIKSSISELDSEKTGLEVEVQRRISYSNLELEASQLGMTKLEKDNVTYIRVNDKDTAVTKSGKVITAK